MRDAYIRYDLIRVSRMIFYDMNGNVCKNVLVCCLCFLGCRLPAQSSSVVFPPAFVMPSAPPPIIYPCIFVCHERGSECVTLRANPVGLTVLPTAAVNWYLVTGIRVVVVCVI